MKTILLTLIAVLFIYSQCYSNNLQVGSGTLTGQNVTSNYTNVQFDLYWDNSWRDAVNWDAVWIFVKYKSTYDSTWNHATLSNSASYHIVPSGFTVSPVTPGVGVFIYRSSNGNGSVSLDDVQLRWIYGSDGLNDADLVEVKVFGIEMVYVPEGSFYAGDGTTSNVAGQFSAGNTTSPFLITGEGLLTLGGTSTSNLGNRNASGMAVLDDFNFTTIQTLPAAFPKGYDQFFCMKYEISQGQYTDFLNTLTRYKQNQRTETDVSTDVIPTIYVMSNGGFIQVRNVIRCPFSGNGTTEPIVFSCNRPDRASNYLSWPDGCAYLDWAGLRPMTELEFEKACRGPLIPVADEFAWGTNTICPDANLTISGTENGTEYITTDVSLGGCCYGNNNPHFGGDGSTGPLRCGIFARSTTTRISSGATYYGIMEMSGNVVERTASVSSSYGRNFTGLHGDGELSVNGHANVTNWPGLSGGEVTVSNGANWRCGSFFQESSLNRISDRYRGAYWNATRVSYFGYRGVRSTTVISDKLMRKKDSNNR
ncbi:SUMF1/EgtB/PvdO family nonheme iron enzyme [Bacteroidota bacterium]